MTITPVEECYAMLLRYELPVQKDETERVDTLRYTWQKLIAHGSQVQDYLITIQPEFRSSLIENVQIFKEDCSKFYTDYDKVIQNIKCYVHFYMTVNFRVDLW